MLLKCKQAAAVPASAPAGLRLCLGARCAAGWALRGKTPGWARAGSELTAEMHGHGGMVVWVGDGRRMPSSLY